MMKVTDEMVDRFLSWPLPDSVCADQCATQRGYPGRSGTTLLTAVEARAMLKHVLDDVLERKPHWRKSPSLFNVRAPLPKRMTTIKTHQVYALPGDLITWRTLKGQDHAGVVEKLKRNRFGRISYKVEDCNVEVLAEELRTVDVPKI